MSFKKKYATSFAGRIITFYGVEIPQNIQNYRLNIFLFLTISRDPVRTCLGDDFLISQSRSYEYWTWNNLCFLTGMSYSRSLIIKCRSCHEILFEFGDEIVICYYYLSLSCLSSCCKTSFIRISEISGSDFVDIFFKCTHC